MKQKEILFNILLYILKRNKNVTWYNLYFIGLSFIYSWFWSRKNTVDKDFYKLSLCSDTKKQAWNKNQNF